MRLFTLTILILVNGFAHAQRLVERSGQAVFYSEAPVENIRAVNEQVLAVVNTENGEVAVSMLMKGFQFKKSLMQEHFNESYVESDKYPKATFKGKIENYDPDMWENERTVTVTGELTIHGVTRSLTAEVQLTPAGELVRAETKFPVRVADHKIKIPNLVIDNIAEVVDVTVTLELKKSQT